MKNIEAPPKKSRCQHISKTGARCHADPQTGRDWCFFHDPEQKKKQAEARKQGGEARIRQTEPEVILPPDLPVIPLQRASDVVALLAQTVDHFRGGQMDLRATKAIAYLASLLLRALKAARPSVVEIVADTINQFRRGQIDLRTAKTLGHLTSVMLSALQQEASEQGMAAAAQTTQLAQATRSNQAVRPDTPRRHDTEVVMSPTAPANPLNPHEPLAAVMSVATANTADHSAARSA